MAFTCDITPKIVSLVAEISKMLGRFGEMGAPPPEPKLRRTALAKTLHATAAIEGNTLSVDQVGAILDGRPVPSKHPREVLEVRNAAAAYDRASKFKPWSVKDFLSAHKIIMAQLEDDAGKFRSGQVGVWQDGKVRHMAPPAKRVPALIDDLFDDLSKAKDLPFLVRAAIVHYEIEFIHPFSDGNGRMGRLWQHVVLFQESPAFQYCPFESVIYARQSLYYNALRAADRKGNAAPFVEFTLDALKVALEDVIGSVRPRKSTPLGRLTQARRAFGLQQFSRKNYMKRFPEISTATASRDLAAAVADGTLVMDGEKALARYQFKKASP